MLGPFRSALIVRSVNASAGTASNRPTTPAITAPKVGATSTAVVTGFLAVVVAFEAIEATDLHRWIHDRDAAFGNTLHQNR